MSTRQSKTPARGRKRSAASQAAALLVALCPRVLQTVRRQLYAAEASGVTLTQQRILRYIADHPGVSLSELALHFMVSAPSASTTVNRLIRARLLIVRTPPHNRRRIALTLTPAGQAVAARALSVSQRKVRSRLAEVPTEQLRQLVPILRTLLRNFQ